MRDMRGTMFEGYKVQGLSGMRGCEVQGCKR